MSVNDLAHGALSNQKPAKAKGYYKFGKAYLKYSSSKK